MFRITSQLREDEFVLKVEGCLAGPCVPELDTCWRGAESAASRDVRQRTIRVDLTDVCHVDAAGRDLLTLMHLAGVRFTCSGCVMPELVREISETAMAGRI
jgi:ABC-type transporter Mla MlaB component